MFSNDLTSRDCILRRARAFAIALTLLAAAASQTACTVVTIHDAEGHTRIERNIGIANIILAPTVSATVAEVKSFGFVSGPLGAQAGFSWNRIAAASAGCRVIVWLETAEQLNDELRREIEQVNGVCWVDSEEQAYASN